jgi:hypothetical protein
VLRPWSLAEVAQTFHGTWEPWDVLPVFYRPLTAADQALAFQAFGLNTWALHALSLVEMATVACLLG